MVVRHEHFQTDQFVTVTIFAKGAAPGDVEVSSQQLFFYKV